MSQNTRNVTDLDIFPPTVHDTTKMTDGIRFHTIDPDPERDIDSFDDDDRLTFASHNYEWPDDL